MLYLNPTTRRLSLLYTLVWGGAEDECNNNDNLWVQWDLTGFYPIVIDVRHVMQ